MRTAEKTTREIAGRRVTLQEGCRYVASRPMAGGGRRAFPVGIYPADHDGFRVIEEPVYVVDGLSYEEANAFMAEFNNGTTSFEGRVW